MTYVPNNIILASDYNNFVTILNQVWSTGTGNFGYGQTAPLSNVSANVSILSAEWIALRTRINTIANHQGTSTVLLPSAASFSLGSTIEAHNTLSPADGLQQMITDVNANHLNAAISSLSLLSTAATSVRTTAWTGTLVHTFTVSFTDENEARYFFNTGGQIIISGSRTGGVVSVSNSDWTGLLSAIGNVVFKYDNVTQTGSGGTGSSLGYYFLTGSYQTIFIQQTPGSLYVPNIYKIQARVENVANLNGGNGRVIKFLITLRDGVVGPLDTIDGTLTSNVDMKKATTYLTVNSPTYAIVTNL